MRKHLLLLLVIALYATGCYADKYQTAIDSLYTVALKQNTAKAYLAVCYSLSEQWSNKAPYKECLEKAAQLMKQGTDQATTATYHHMQALYHRYANENELFKAELAKAQQLYTTLRNAEELATTFNELGNLYLHTNLDSAHYYFDRGLETLKGKKCKITGNLMNNKALALYYKGDTEQALQLFKEIAHLLIELNDPDPLTTIYSSIATLYANKEQEDSSLVYYQKAIASCEETGNTFNKSGLMGGISNLYAKKEHFEEALEYAHRSVAAAEAHPTNKQSYFMAYYRRGALQELTKNYRAAIDDLLFALESVAQENSPKLSLKCMPGLIASYIDLGMPDSVQYYIQKGEAYLEQLNSLTPEAIGFLGMRGKVYLDQKEYAKGLHDFLTLRDAKFIVTPLDEIYRYIAQAYAGLKEYPKAYLYMDSAAVRSDSISRKKYEKSLSKFNVEFNTQEKELQISKLQEEQLTQKNFQLKLTISFILCMFLTLLFILYLLYKRRMQKMRTLQLEQDMVQQEQAFATLQKDTDLRLARKYIEGLESERSRLAKELHDGVCNDLLGIQLLVQEHHTPSAGLQQVLSMLDTTRSSVRAISHELMPPAFQYATIDECLDDYVRNLPLPAGTHITYQSDRHIDWALVNQQISHQIYRIVQETLGNIIKHADATQIALTLKAEADCFVLEVRDNGKKKYTPSHRHTGIGTHTLEDRIKSIAGEYLATYTEGTHLQKFIIKQTMYQ